MVGKRLGRERKVAIMVADYEWIMVCELAVENHYNKEKPLLLKTTPAKNHTGYCLV